jgi:hypothetical protein
MEKEQRSRLQKATQDARKLLEEEFRGQLLQTYDIDVEKVRWAEEPGAHLQAEQRLIREKLVAWIEHKEAQINDRKEALLLVLREMAFTALNRFVALKLMEARELVRPCVSGGLESAGFLEFTAVAQGLLVDQEGSYRLYLETIFEDVSRELRALFDPRDPASLIWPKRAGLLELLDILNRPELAELWGEDETLGWVYQYFNGDAERKKMREESAAPRNSRELAVRNQFFTPRYVVEFLTDNTLGRIWYEMRQGNTILKDRCCYLVRRTNEIWLLPGEEPPEQPDTEESLGQEELICQPVHIPHRPLKDPRQIRMLDPACGSMHFGLYAFDLYLEIYTEAWEIAQRSDDQDHQAKAFEPFVAFAADFTDKVSYLREVPCLILKYNIHGIDIDPRATQIARLTLWLRAQRAWMENAVEIAERPSISRSNVVCAEPMPGEIELLDEFIKQAFAEQERAVAQKLLQAVFAKMQLAGEAGSLLKIEEEIREAIDQARQEWSMLEFQQNDLFDTNENVQSEKANVPAISVLGHIPKAFWLDIEERIYAALRNYAEKAESGGFQRRLFADDAAHGFAFIDLCRRKYDAVLMNPPFGLSSLGSFQYTREVFPGSCTELLATFVERGWGISCGFLGAITSRSFMVANSLHRWRREVVIPSLAAIGDLGADVMDGAFVEAAAYILSDNPGKAVLALDARESINDTSVALLRWSNNPALPEGRRIERSAFLLFPKERIIYALPPRATSLLQSPSKFEPLAGTAREGFRTWDDFRFVRLHWEVNPASVGQHKTWEPLTKGGAFSRYRSNVHLLANTKDNIAESRAINIAKNGTDAQARQASSYWRRPGITYSIRSQKGFSARVMPAGCLFTGQGPLIVSESGVPNEYILGWLNSKLITSLLEIQSNDGKFMTGLIKSLPWIAPGNPDEVSRLSQETYCALVELKSLSALDESDPHFVSPLFDSSVMGMSRKAAHLRESVACVIDNLDVRWNAHISSLYQIKDGEVDEIGRQALGASEEASQAAIDDSDSEEETSSDSSRRSLAISIFSYAIGVCFGRWDIRCSFDDHNASAPSDPFAPLPACPPGQLQNSEGFAASCEDLPAAYPVKIKWDGILVGDTSNPSDICDNVCRVIQTIWGSRRESAPSGIIQECCESLGVARVGDWLLPPSGFFADHLRRYSRSRRQAPIYWLLSSGSGSYEAWLYYHRVTQDTLYRVLRDFVEPRFRQAEREQFELQSQGGLSSDASSRLQEVQNLLNDLRLFKSELDLVAPLWNPYLDDGVIINHAILWRITPYTPWQKKCKECWDKLVKGDYDWAHLAFHLWPERVIRACTTDRSLAIAHRLEDRLWQETNNGNWLPRQLTEADLQALIAEHSKPAVKSALERFLAAPAPVAPTRTRASRSTRASGSSAPRRPRGTAAVVDAEATRQVLLALTAAPSDGLAKAAIADLIGVEANALTAVIKQLKDSGQIDQLGERRGARYVLSEQGRAAVEQEEAG